jgi:hypothetical protein
VLVANAATRNVLSTGLEDTKRRVNQLMIVAIVAGLASIAAVGILLVRG